MTSGAVSRPSLGVFVPDCPAHLRNVIPTDMTLDSRELLPGGLFVALPGTASDGRRFIGDVLSRGASAVLAEADGLKNEDPRIIALSNLAENLPALVQDFYDRPSEKISLVAVTGTNGKTSIVDFTCQILRLLGRESGSIGTLGARTDNSVSPATNTTPDLISITRQLALWEASGIRFVSIEASSHALDQGRLLGLSVDTAVFTNLSRDHLDYHGSEEEYAAAKLKLFTDFPLKHAIYNEDDPIARRVKDLLPDAAIGVSLVNASADVFIDVIEQSPLSFRLKTPFGEGRITSRLSGEFNAFNLGVAIAVVQGLGIATHDVIEAAEQVSAVVGRVEAIGPAEGPRVFIDYAHTPDALERTLAALRPTATGKLIVVFGCGGDRDRGKRPAMGAIAQRLADVVVVTSDNPRGEQPEAIIDDVIQGISEDYIRLSDRAEAIGAALDLAAPGDTVLVAGKGHERYQEINGCRVPFCDREVVEAWCDAKGLAR